MGEGGFGPPKSLTTDLQSILKCEKILIYKAFSAQKNQKYDIYTTKRYVSIPPIDKIVHILYDIDGLEEQTQSDKKMSTTGGRW